MELQFEQLIVGRGDYDTGVIATYRDIKEGNVSRTPDDPIKVCWIRNENKFLITDGYHRLVERILRKEKSFICEIDWTGYTTKWKVPAKKDRISEIKEVFKLTESRFLDMIKKDVIAEIRKRTNKSLFE